MNQQTQRPKAITLDFYQTLAHIRGGRGRGVLYHEFLADHGLKADAWEHQVIYDVFEYYGDAYDPDASRRGETEFWTAFTARLFERTGVADGRRLAGVHALQIRDIFGSRQFRLFPEVKEVLGKLSERGFPLAVVSNWPAGLGKLCHELGISGHFREVIASAEVGHEKPAAEIFLEACRRLGFEPAEVLHVGDSVAADVEGAQSAGLTALLIDRDGERETGDVRAVSSLDEILELVAG